MKTAFFIVFILLLSQTFVFAQKHKSISVVVLKENHLIDSLLKIVLNPNSTSRIDTLISKTDCINISVWNKGMGIYSFDVDIIDENLFLSTPQRLNSNKDAIGYFVYNKIKVFVLSYEGFFSFFHKTSTHKVFEFSPKNYGPLDVMLIKTMLHYRYENEHFTETFNTIKE